MTHRESLFVISDLHLGGATGFQICTARSRRRLAAFIRGLPRQLAPGQHAHLVLNGDIVDFLAEEPFEAFTSDDVLATRKLARIMDHGDTADVWEALRELVAAGHSLTLLLGNHDLELSLPGPRRLLYERIGQRGVEFIMDGQALVRGPVLIEHGNRYDDWNVVSHDDLRTVRSALSRREAPPPMRTVPGSELVVGVMNDLKRQYAFIDLLKPENEAAIPLLAVLDPGQLGKLKKLSRLVRQLSRTQVRRDGSGVPEERDLISSEAWRAEQLLQEAKALMGLSDDEIGAREHLQSWWKVYRAGGQEKRREKLRHLREALQIYVREQRETFTVDEESPRYLRPAEALAKRGFRVVVFGHTHLPKRVPMLGGAALYLNTGTWAELMRIPDKVLSDSSEGDTVLAEFVEAVSDNQLGPWRTLVPTFARIEREGDTLVSADVFLFEEDGTVRPVGARV